MDKKIVFFDIDGTIWDSSNVIPQSTIKAVNKLKEAGHLTFINTGRSRGYIRHPQLLGMGFDGIISGCGTMIEVGDSIIQNSIISEELKELTLNAIKESGAHAILEGRKHLYMDKSFFADDRYGKKLIRDMGEDIKELEDVNGESDIYKLCVDMHGDADTERFYELLKDHYQFMGHTPEIFELVPHGFDKGYGIKKVCDYTGIPIENTYAFGDSINDKEMMEAVAHPIAMGNGSEDIKKICEYITDELYSDGIYNACKYYKLI